MERADLPESVRDIFDRISDERKQQILDGYEGRYAPFLAMLAGWKQAVHQHHAQGREAALKRLTEEFFPTRGDWHFPVQSLVVPQSMPETPVDIQFGDMFHDVVPPQRPWLASGPARLQPVKLTRVEWNPEVSLKEIKLTGVFSESASLNSIFETGILVFFAVPEPVIKALESAEWWLSAPDAAPRRIRMLWHEDSHQFEREMAMARLRQRQLDPWLPAFYPYGRKIMRLTSEGVESKEGKEDKEDKEGITSGKSTPPLQAKLDAGTFLITGAFSDPHTAAALHPKTQIQAVFNPVPVVQAAVEPTTAGVPGDGKEGGRTISMPEHTKENAVPGFFAGLGTDPSGAPVPTTLVRLPAEHPMASMEAEVRFPRSAAQVVQTRLYYGSAGPAAEAPQVLESVKDLMRFVVPKEREDGSATGKNENTRSLAPAVGGLTVTDPTVESNESAPMVGGMALKRPKPGDEAARMAWYHSVLRPPLLSEGDLREILEQRACAYHGMVRLKSVRREIAHRPNDTHSHRRSYLWPSLCIKEESFNAARDEIPAPHYLPMVQKLTLCFERGERAEEMPDYLLSDAADYLASIVSQYFVLSCFRVEGVVV